MRLPLRLVFAAALLGLLPLPLHAASQITCGNYMLDAVKKAEEARQSRCGFSGPVWSTDGLGHKRSCEGANDESVAHEKQERANALGKCQSCRRYASETQQAVARATQFKCGFSGARWSPDTEGHFRWCMGLNEGPSHPASPTWSERDARQAELGKCVAQSDPNAGHTLGKRKRKP